MKIRINDTILDTDHVVRFFVKNGFCSYDLMAQMKKGSVTLQMFANKLDAEKQLELLEVYGNA